MRRCPSGASSPRAFAALFVVLFALAAVPVLRADMLPLVDYPTISRAWRSSRDCRTTRLLAAIL